eukprot:m.259521 g.259521  ORF g.259521 m.259521 type:complete len:61 (+) comp15554_c2_seq5:96-278(+)
MPKPADGYQLLLNAQNTSPNALTAQSARAASQVVAHCTEAPTCNLQTPTQRHQSHSPQPN